MKKFLAQHVIVLLILSVIAGVSWAVLEAAEHYEQLASFEVRLQTENMERRYLIDAILKKQGQPDKSLPYVETVEEKEKLGDLKVEQAKWISVIDKSALVIVGTVWAYVAFLIASLAYNVGHWALTTLKN